MKSLLLTFLLILSVACDTPVRNRSPYAQPTDTSSKDNPDDNPSVGGQGKDNDGDGDAGEGGSGSETTQDDGFKDCNIGYVYYALRIGNFGLCQSSKDETKFKLKLANADTSIGTCFVPIHVNSDGSSYHLGSAQCVNQEADRVYDMTLTKDRTENINGVMVVKANALNGYMQCMTAKMQFIQTYNNCVYNSYCMASADQWAQEVCYNFTQVYDGHYYQVNL